jgi:hypothetical protein
MSFPNIDDERAEAQKPATGLQFRRQSRLWIFGMRSRCKIKTDTRRWTKSYIKIGKTPIPYLKKKAYGMDIEKCRT